jgi:hypothetical protein
MDLRFESSFFTTMDILWPPTYDSHVSNEPDMTIINIAPSCLIVICEHRRADICVLAVKNHFLFNGREAYKLGPPWSKVMRETLRALASSML